MCLVYTYNIYFARASIVYCNQFKIVFCLLYSIVQRSWGWMGHECIRLFIYPFMPIPSPFLGNFFSSLPTTANKRNKLVVLKYYTGGSGTNPNLPALSVRIFFSLFWFHLNSAAGGGLQHGTPTIERGKIYDWWQWICTGRDNTRHLFPCTVFSFGMLEAWRQRGLWSTYTKA